MSNATDTNYFIIFLQIVVEANFLLVFIWPITDVRSRFVAQAQKSWDMNPMSSIQ